MPYTTGAIYLLGLKQSEAILHSETVSMHDTQTYN